MTAKEYLEQINLFNIRIRHREEEIKDLERIQTEHASFIDERTSQDLKIINERASQALKNDTNQRDRIIGQILNLKKKRHLTYLYLRYVKGLSHSLIADIMHMSSIRYVYSIQKASLQDFQETYKDHLMTQSTH